MITKPNPILEKSLSFALWIIEFSEELRKKHFYTLKEQVFASGTSIGANVREAQSPESKQDFLHKMKLAIKEAEETRYWLLLCKLSKILPSPPEEQMNELEQMIKILGKIISRLNNAR